MPSRDYQPAALSSLLASTSAIKALIMPTGSGKTRVALEFAKRRIEEGKNVAYIAESIALVKQVLDEAEIVGIDARWIPGAYSETAPDDIIEHRDENLEDYNYGVAIGVFPYASYFSGSDVPRANTLIIDDAHALDTAHYSCSVIRIDNANSFRSVYRQIVDVLKEGNPTLSPFLDEIDIPIHIGGHAVLVPPSPTAEINDVIYNLVRDASVGTGYNRYSLRRNLEGSARHFLNWPCVVTSESISWRPFVIPFESLGQTQFQPIPEEEIVLLTATKGTPDFLQTRLGLTSQVSSIPRLEDIPEMGTRLVIPYQELRAVSPPSLTHAKIIQDCAIGFGSILVTLRSDQGEIKLKEMMPGNIHVVRYQDRTTLNEFRDLPTPKVLVLVNRPVGIDLPRDVCRVAVHLDLPYSSSGHEVVAGDIEKLGDYAEASLGVRLSQLLGRLNREPEDRSVHFLLAGNLPMQRGSTFIKSLDPAVLLDILIGQRGIRRAYPLPNVELYERAMAFLDGDDSLRTEHQAPQEVIRDRITSADSSAFHPNASTIIEANLMLSRGNYLAAIDKFRRLAQDAEHNNSPAHAAYYEYQLGTAGILTGVDQEEVYGVGGCDAIFRQALQRNPGSPHLVRALTQATSTVHEPEETFYESQTRFTLKVHSLRFFERWLVNSQTDLPTESEQGDHNAWKRYWRRRLSSPDHTELLNAWSDAFQLLGSNTPQLEMAQNDARVSWTDLHEQRSLALEVKGRQPNGGESTRLTDDDVMQASANASRIDANYIILVTSKAGHERDVPQHARNRGVRVIQEEAATAFADCLATQCSELHQVQIGTKSTNELPHDFMDVRELIDRATGVIDGGMVRGAFSNE